MNEKKSPKNTRKTSSPADSFSETREAPNEISPTMHDPKTQASFDIEARKELEEYFSDSAGSSTEKLENFTKYVPRQNLARFLVRYEIFRLIKNLQGSIVECGVLFGGGLMSFAKLSTILEPYNFQRRIIGFDSFSGFPEISAADTLGLSERKSGHLKSGGFSGRGSYEDLLESVRIYDISRPLNHFPKVKIVKGDFKMTGPRYLDEYPHLIISCLYLDFDLYEPTKLALELFLSRVPKGGVIVFDELNDEAFPGETLAVMEQLNISDVCIHRFDFEPRISYMIVGE